MAQFRRFSADWLSVRYVKLLLVLGLVTALGLVWRTSDVVRSAYADERPPVDFRLTAGEFSVDRAALGPSPFLVNVPRPDLTRVVVAPIAVEGPNPPAVLIAGGESVLAGVVLGPAGPVAGAVVQLERHVAQGSAPLQVITDAAGLWEASGLLGGRFLVRAYVPNEFTDPSPQVFFLGEGEHRRVDVTLAAPSDQLVVGLHTTPPHYLGLPAVAAVTVGRESIDVEGRLVVRPVAAQALTVRAKGSAVLVEAPGPSTDGNGTLRLTVVCMSVGAAEVEISTVVAAEDPVGTQVFTIALPACEAIPQAPPEADQPANGSAAGDG